MAELNIIEKVIALEAVDLLKNLSAEQLSRIASIAKEIRYPPGKLMHWSGHDDRCAARDSGRSRIDLTGWHRAARRASA